MIIRIVLFALFLLWPSLVWGATVYTKDISNTVYYEPGASSCDDITSDDTSGDLQAALNAAGAGGTLYICGGTYTGTEIDTGAGLNSFSTNQTIIGLGTVMLSAPDASGDVIGISHTGTILENLILDSATTAGKYGIRSSVAITVTDVTIQNCNRALYFTAAGGGGTFTRLVTKNIADSTYFFALANTTAMTFNYCILGGGAGGSIRTLAAINATFNNCIFVGFEDLVIFNNQASTMVFNNCIIAANNYKGDNSVVIQTTVGLGDFTFNNCILADNIQNTDRFFGNSPNSLTYNNTVFEQDPRWLGPSRDYLFYIFLDDTENLDAWYDLADVANAMGIPVSFAMYRFGADSVDWEKIATYINAGNEIASHGWSAARVTIMDAITITHATATITVSINQSDADSANWTGTLSLSTGESYDLTLAANDTVGELVTQIDALSGYTAAIPGTQFTTGSKSIALADVAGQTLSGGYTAQFDQTPFLQTEILDSKEWIEAQIQTYIPSFTVKSFVYSGGLSDATSKAYTLSTAGYSQARGLSGNSFSSKGFDLASTKSLNFSSSFGSVEADIQNELGGVVAAAKYASGYVGLHDHGFGATSLASWTVALNYLSSNGIIVKTFADAMDDLRSKDDHVTSNLSYRCGDEDYSCFEDYNFRLSPKSPAIDAGTDVGLVRDFTNIKIPHGKTFDIGAYEYVFSTLGSGLGPKDWKF